jgi:hypothetical protein
MSAEPPQLPPEFPVCCGPSESLGGIRGLVTSRAVSRGEVLLTDVPAVMTPYADVMGEYCSMCLAHCDGGWW